MARLRRLDSPGRCHTSTHNTTHHGESPCWWLLWCSSSSQWVNITSALWRPDSYLSWLAIVGDGEECCCLSKYLRRSAGSLLMADMVHGSFLTNSIVCCACKIISSGVMNIMEVLTMTNLRLLYRLVYSDVAINAWNEVILHFCSTTNFRSFETRLVFSKRLKGFSTF